MTTPLISPDESALRSWATLLAPHGSLQAMQVLGVLKELDCLRHLLEGENKARDLLLRGMESQAELLDGLKQKCRMQEGELER